MFKKINFAIFSILLFFSKLSAYSDTVIKHTDIGLAYTFRQDDLKLKFDGSLCSYFDKLEQKFDTIKTHQMKGTANFSTHCNVYFKNKIDYGWIVNGATRRKQEQEALNLTFKEKGCIKDGYMFDLSSGVGCIWDCGCKEFKFIPLVGYAWDQQHIGASNPCVCGSALKGKHERYTANWFGPWIGFDVILDYYCDWQFNFAFEYHFVEHTGSYSHSRHGVKDRNGSCHTFDPPLTLKDLFYDRIHRKDAGCGHGFVANFGLRRECPRDNWYTFFMGGLEAYNVHHGYGKITNTREIYELNHLNWRSYQITIGLGFFY